MTLFSPGPLDDMPYEDMLAARADIAQFAAAMAAAPVVSVGLPGPLSAGEAAPAPRVNTGLAPRQGAAPDRHLLPPLDIDTLAGPNGTHGHDALITAARHRRLVTLTNGLVVTLTGVNGDRIRVRYPDRHRTERTLRVRALHKIGA